ncbi:MAG: peptidoglycan DD-metalloendopeptidase family protein [Rhizobiales bacterium]|nr:peptidoglycan DD-metalloendopeptidase family protein [Hyphomicrobiales bacterium]
MLLTRCSSLALLLAVLTLAGPPARAGNADRSQELSTVEQELQSSQSAQDRISADLAATRNEQDDIAARLVDLSQKIQSAEAAISGSEGKLAKLGKEKVTILARLAEKQDVISELLAGLQRLEQDPPPALVVEPSDVLAALRGAMMFGVIVPELRDEADRLAADLARLDRLSAGIQANRKAIAADIARLAAARTELARLIDRKKATLVEGNARLGQERQRAADLAARAQSLKQLMAALTAERQRTEAEQAKQTALAETERHRREALAQQPRLAFSDTRGRLAYPAQGQILKRFGDDDGLGGTVQGTVIATRQEAQVTAPSDARVEFAGPFRSYGQVVILNPGGGYRILLAGMGTITAGTGEFLRAGEPVGQMGNGPSSVTLLGDLIQDSRPVLYIEFRNNTEAIDSAPWWIGGTKEARG